MARRKAALPMTTAQQLGSIIKSARQIMRKDNVRRCLILLRALGVMNQSISWFHKSRPLGSVGMSGPKEDVSSFCYFLCWQVLK